MPFPTIPFAVLLVACTFSSVLAQSPSSFPPHCLPRVDSDPYLDPQSCAIAINHFSADSRNETGVLTNGPAGARELQLPWDRTYGNCRLRVELLYANEVNQSTYDVWSQGNRLNTECMLKADYFGGIIIVDNVGLTVSFRPSGDDNGWEQRFSAGSVVVGQGDGSSQDPRLTQVTGSARRRSKR